MLPADVLHTYHHIIIIYTLNVNTRHCTGMYAGNVHDYDVGVYCSNFADQR